MPNTVAEYQISITRTGEGAAQAASDFQKVAAAATTANTALGAASAGGVTAFTNSAKTATSMFKAMQGTLTLVGLQTFPQLTIAANTAGQAINGLKAASALTGTSFAALGVQLGVIAGGFI